MEVLNYLAIVFILSDMLDTLGLRIADQLAVIADDRTGEVGRVMVQLKRSHQLAVVIATVIAARSRVVGIVLCRYDRQYESTVVRIGVATGRLVSDESRQTIAAREAALQVENVRKIMSTYQAKLFRECCSDFVVSKIPIQIALKCYHSYVCDYRRF